MAWRCTIPCRTAFREQLTKAGAIERLFARFDAVLRAAMGGQIVDATVVEARRPRLTKDATTAIEAGAVPEAWSQAKRAQMDTDGRWTIKRGRQHRQAKANPRHIVGGNASRARVRVALEHVVAAQKCRLGLVVHSVGLARATARVGLANLVTNMRRSVWFTTRAAPA